MAQAHFLRHLSGHTALAPCRLRGVEDWTSVPFFPLMSPDQGQTCLQTRLSLWGTREKVVGGMGEFPVLPPLLSEVRAARSVALSLFTPVRVQRLRCLPLFPQCAGLTFPHPTPLPAPFPPSFPPCLPQQAMCSPFRRCSSWVSAPPNVVRDEVPAILVFLQTGAGRSVAGPFLLRKLRDSVLS